MRELLRQQGFPDSGIRLLRDDRRTSYTSSAGGELPTKQNIISGLRWLVNGAARGDALFFHFSGHGAQQRDTTGDEADGYDETILPCDGPRGKRQRRVAATPRQLARIFRRGSWRGYSAGEVGADIPTRRHAVASRGQDESLGTPGSQVISNALARSPTTTSSRLS